MENHEIIKLSLVPNLDADPAAPQIVPEQPVESASPYTGPAPDTNVYSLETGRPYTEQEITLMAMGQRLKSAERLSELPISHESTPRTRFSRAARLAATISRRSGI